MGYKGKSQGKNLAWFLPRPKPDKYKGGMPLYCEEWIIELAKDILGKKDIELMNLFSGMNKLGFKVDIKEEVNPDFVCDAHRVADVLKEKQFDVILADPPYSNEEAKKLYGVRIPLNYKVWTNQCMNLLKEGGLLIVYHKYVMPNPNPDVFEVVKRVFVGNRVYHLPRIATFFIKKKKGSRQPSLH